MKIIIPSRNRADVIGDKALRLFPDATLCAGEDEADAYGRLSDRLLVHPPNVVGVGPLRQWVLDHVDDPCVVMVDDDVTHVYSQIGFHKRRIEDADTTRALVERVAILAQDAGVRVFGFNQAARPLSYSNCRPLSLDTSQAPRSSAGPTLSVSEWRQGSCFTRCSADTRSRRPPGRRPLASTATSAACRVHPSRQTTETKLRQGYDTTRCARCLTCRADSALITLSTVAKMWPQLLEHGDYVD